MAGRANEKPLATTAPAADSGVPPKPGDANMSTTRAMTFKASRKAAVRSMLMPQVVEDLVELSGIEPLTSSLRTRRSPN